MDIIYEIRRRRNIQHQTISAIARDMGLCRATVRKHLHTTDEPRYRRSQPEAPQLGKFEQSLSDWLTQEASLPRARRRSARRLF